MSEATTTLTRTVTKQAFCHPETGAKIIYSLV